MKKIIAIVTGMLVHTAVLANCDADIANIGAHYQITKQIKPIQTSEHSTGSASHSTSSIKENMLFWRRGNEVAHEYPEAGITEIWNLVSNGQVRPIRYFDKEKRGIEYQPDDINKGKGDRDWSGKFQLISDAQLAAMTLVSRQGQGCKAEEVYHLETSTLKSELVWLPQLKLVKRFSEERPNFKLIWNLQEIIHEPKQINRIFATRSDFLLMDYADIGDNESDPFVRKLINQGFVSHTTSGFYNEHGQPIAGEHSGHSH